MDKELIDEISKQADIVKVISSYINVIKKGKNFVALCPFHDDSNPSLQISPERNMFHCFVDGHAGNAFSFVMQYEHVSFIEAVKKVAEIIGFDDPRLHEKVFVHKIDDNLMPLINCINDLNAYYEYSLITKEGVDALNYLNKRGINKAMREKFHIGYSLNDGLKTIKFLRSKGHSLKTIEDIGITLNRGENSYDSNQGRIIFALFDHNNQCVGFSARRLNDNDNTPKYINTSETKLFTKGKIFYNFYNAKNAAKIKKYIYVLEGFMDVIALDKINYDNAVALMGTALSKEHIQALRKLGVEVRLCLDGDKPGQSAMMRIVPELLANNIPVRIVNNQNSNLDPDEIYNESGAEALSKYLENLLSPFDFTINYYKNTEKLESVDDKKKLIMRFLPLLLATKSQLELDDYIYKLSEVTGFNAMAIKKSIANARNKKEEKNEKNIATSNRIISTFHPERKELRRLEKAEREILFHMLTHDDAIKFYEDYIESFYTNTYRLIANFIIDNRARNNEPTINGLITNIEMSDMKNKEQLKATISNIVEDKSHLKYNDKLLKDCKDIIDNEKKKIHKRNIIIKATEGKSADEKARVIADTLRNE